MKSAFELTMDLRYQCNNTVPIDLLLDLLGRLHRDNLCTRPEKLKKIQMFRIVQVLAPEYL